MKTYGLKKDYRYKLYMLIILISSISYALIYYYGISKIKVPEVYILLISILLSFISVTGIATILFYFINFVYGKINSINGKYQVKCFSSYIEKESNEELTTQYDAEIEVKVNIKKQKLSLRLIIQFRKVKRFLLLMKIQTKKYLLILFPMMAISLERIIYQNTVELAFYVLKKAS